MKILTEQEVDDIQLSLMRVKQHGVQNFARAIESAVLEKLKAQEPVAWKFELKAGEWSVTLYEYNVTLGYASNVVPLYTNPLPPDDVVQKYEELLYEVHRKFPDETRHQTALRYIKTAEAPSYTNIAMKEMK